MTAPDLASWAVPRLSQLLPLDDESLTQIITYSTSLSKAASAEHLKNLLGDSPAALEFISSFNSRRETDRPSSAGKSTPSQPGENERGNTRERPSAAGAGTGMKKGKKSARAPLHSTGPPRRPENYGNTTGGYKKSDLDEDYMSATISSRERSTAGSARNPEAAALQVPSPTGSPYVSSAGSSRNQSPAPKATIHSTSTAKPPPSASGPLISDFLPNVRSKAAKHRQGGGVVVSGGGGGPGGSNSGTSTPSKRSASPAITSLTTNNIADLTAAIAALEVSTNPTLSGQAAGGSRQKCNCYATLHPLFEPAPNCVNCGKIICALEGLQPCSFCGTSLLSSEEVQSMIRELRAERGQEKMRVHNESVTHRDHMGTGPGSGAGPGAGPGSSPSKLDAARAHRDKLLAFQAQNARRTRVVDEAADFETPNIASTLWMTPAQRALALKKQQRVQRELEEKARPEWEKKKTVLSLDIKGGRVTRVYHTGAGGGAGGGNPDANAVDAVEDEEMAQLTRAAAAEQSSTSRRGGEAFSCNPLLAAGGLLRPIWKAPSGKEADPGTTHAEHKQTWRRVQDDTDDNEQWILDGGAHGYST